MHILKSGDFGRGTVFLFASLPGHSEKELISRSSVPVGVKSVFFWKNTLLLAESMLI